MLLGADLLGVRCVLGWGMHVLWLKSAWGMEHVLNVEKLALPAAMLML
jgi:hypothetical protein